MATQKKSMGTPVRVPEFPEMYSYDADGNLASDGRWNYTWDAENRLIAMETIGTAPAAARKRMTFEYDYMSRRVLKYTHDWDGVSNTWSSGFMRKYYYDGWNLIGEEDETGLVKSYLWGTDLSGTPQGAGGVGGLLKIEDWYTWPSSSNPAQHESYAISDANGNVMKLVDARTLDTVADYEYGPFGELIRMTGDRAKANPFRFSTKYQDEESGLLYYGYRYYNANTGGWISRDPLEEFGGLNLFAFGNSPVNTTDYLGLITEVKELAIIADSNSWPILSKLFLYWDSAIYDPGVLYQSPNEQLVKMGWILTDKKSNAVYQVAKKSGYRTPDAIRAIKKQMQRLVDGPPKAKPRRVDFTAIPPRRNYEEIRYINVYGVVTGDLPFVASWNDVQASLHAFNYYIAFAGDVCMASRVVTVDKIGIYARDSFDFQGEQELGAWGWKSPYVVLAGSKTGGYTPITNSWFRAYQARTKRGMDFILYSDWSKEDLSENDKIDVSF